MSSKRHCIKVLSQVVPGRRVTVESCLSLVSPTYTKLMEVKEKVGESLTTITSTLSCEYTLCLPVWIHQRHARQWSTFDPVTGFQWNKDTKNTPAVRIMHTWTWHKRNAYADVNTEKKKERMTSLLLLVYSLKWKPCSWHAQCTHTNITPVECTQTQPHTAVHGGDCGQAVQGSLAESLIDWDKGLLMRQIAHQAGTTCF